MNKRIFLILSLIGLAALLFFTFSKVYTKKSGKIEAPGIKESLPPLRSGELSIFGALDDVKARQGTPLVVQWKFNQGEVPKNLDSIELEVREAAGKTKAWPFEKKINPDSNSILWSLNAEQFGEILPGFYELMTLVSNRLTLEVLPYAQDLKVKQKRTARAREIAFLEAQGKKQEVTQKVETWIQEDPTSEAYALKAKQLEAVGNKQRAFAAYNDAIREHLKRHPNASEPPLELFHEQGRLFNELLEEEKKNPTKIDPSKFKKWPDDFPEFASAKKVDDQKKAPSNS